MSVSNKRNQDSWKTGLLQDWIRENTRLAWTSCGIWNKGSAHTQKRIGAYQKGTVLKFQKSSQWPKLECEQKISQEILYCNTKYKINIRKSMLAVVVQLLSHVWLLVTLWTVARQAPLSTGFPRQEYWSGLSFLSPGDLPNPGIEPVSPILAGGFFTMEPPGKP